MRSTRTIPRPPESARTLFKERDALGVTEFAFYCARTGFLQRNHAALTDFFEDMVRATRWMLAAENRGDATRMLADVTKQSSDVLATYYLLPGEDVYRDPDARPDIEALQHNLDAMQELGFIWSRIDVAKHTDLSFIDAAVGPAEAAEQCQSRRNPRKAYYGFGQRKPETLLERLRIHAAAAKLD